MTSLGDQGRGGGGCTCVYVGLESHGGKEGDQTKQKSDLVRLILPIMQLWHIAGFRLGVIH